jgi:hypothetical protein
VGKYELRHHTIPLLNDKYMSRKNYPEKFEIRREGGMVGSLVNSCLHFQK